MLSLVCLTLALPLVTAQVTLGNGPSENIEYGPMDYLDTDKIPSLVKPDDETVSKSEDDADKDLKLDCTYRTWDNAADIKIRPTITKTHDADGKPLDPPHRLFNPQEEVARDVQVFDGWTREKGLYTLKRMTKSDAGRYKCDLLYINGRATDYNWPFYVNTPSKYFNVSYTEPAKLYLTGSYQGSPQPDRPNVYHLTDQKTLKCEGEGDETDFKMTQSEMRTQGNLTLIDWAVPDPTNPAQVNLNIDDIVLGSPFLVNCSAKKGAERVKKTFFIQKIAPVEVLGSKDVGTWNLNENVNRTFRYRSYPSPIIKIFKDGKSVTIYDYGAGRPELPGYNISIFLKPGDKNAYTDVTMSAGKLRIEYVGTYTVQLTNGVDDDADPVTLNFVISGKPIGAEVVSDETGEMQNTTHVLLVKTKSFAGIEVIDVKIRADGKTDQRQVKDYKKIDAEKMGLMAGFDYYRFKLDNLKLSTKYTVSVNIKNQFGETEFSPDYEFKTFAGPTLNPPTSTKDASYETKDKVNDNSAANILKISPLLLLVSILLLH